MPISARVRSLTKRPSLLEARAKGTILEVISVMDFHVDQVIRYLSTFEPPVKPNSKYVRTHTARDSWSRSDTKVTEDGLVTRISNDAGVRGGREYSSIVYGDEEGRNQDPYGNIAPGWPLMAEVLRTGFDKKIRRAVKRALQ